MNISGKKRILVICAYLGPVISGLAGFAAPVGAQTLAARAMSRSDSFAASVTPGGDSATDEELSKRVQVALHSDPYFYDRHVSVSVEKGVVVLRGIVFSASDLQSAIRIADRAAGHRRVVDDLWIDLGERNAR
jgi:osmotically-inducible protein OsmY